MSSVTSNIIYGIIIVSKKKRRGTAFYITSLFQHYLSLGVCGGKRGHVAVCLLAWFKADTRSNGFCWRAG
jgi:hypothetical protein